MCQWVALWFLFCWGTLVWVSPVFGRRANRRRDARCFGLIWHQVQTPLGLIIPRSGFINQLEKYGKIIWVYVIWTGFGNLCPFVFLDFFVLSWSNVILPHSWTGFLQGIIQKLQLHGEEFSCWKASEVSEEVLTAYRKSVTSAAIEESHQAVFLCTSNVLLWNGFGNGLFMFFRCF